MSDIDFDKLERAMEAYNVAKSEHDKAWEEYDGYSWDYYGGDFIDAMELAQKAWREEFQKAVNAAVEARLKEMGRGP